MRAAGPALRSPPLSGLVRAAGLPRAAPARAGPQAASLSDSWQLWQPPWDTPGERGSPGERRAPCKLLALPLGLGSLEHEFGGLHKGVFGHGSGDNSVEGWELAQDKIAPLEQERTREERRRHAESARTHRQQRLGSTEALLFSTRTWSPDRVLLPVYSPGLRQPQRV